MIAILQKVATSDEFKIVYKVNPKHIYDELVLFETILLKTKWKRQLAQMNRRKKRVDLDDEDEESDEEE